MPALSYRQVLERYDRAKAFGETKSLQEYSSHLNDIYGTQDFSEGLRDGPWTRFSTRTDQVLGDTVGQVTGPLGGALGGLFGQEEAGTKVGEGLPRALLQTLPLYLAGPEAGIPATVAALGATGAAFGGQTYADTGSAKAALLSGATATVLPPVGRFAGELGAAAFGAPRIAGELAAGGGYMNSVVPTTVGQRAAAFGASQLAQGALQEASGYAQQKTTNPDEPYNFLSPEFLIGQIPFTVHDAVGTFGKPLMTREQAQGLVKKPVLVSKGTEKFVPPENTIEEQATAQAAMDAYTQVAQDQSIDPVEKAKKLAALLATVNQPKTAEAVKQVEKVAQPSPLDSEVTLSGKAEKMTNGSYRVRVDDLQSAIPVRLPEHRTVFVNGAEPVVDPVTGKATFKVKVSQVDPRAKYGIAEEQQQLDPNQNPELPVQEQGPLTSSEKAALDSVGVEHAKIVGFTTSKGSTYTLKGNTTQRTKTLHEGHDPKDVGLKTPSQHTVYVDPAFATEVGMWQSSNWKDKQVGLTPDGKVILTSVNPETGVRDRDSVIGNNAFSLTPEVGKSPLELWKFNQEGRFEGNHPGNPIVELKQIAEQIERAQVQHEDAMAKSAVVPTKPEEWQDITDPKPIQKSNTILTDARWHGDDSISISFDATGNVPTPKSLEALFKAQGFNVGVEQFQTNLVSATQGKVKYRIIGYQETPGSAMLRNSKKVAEAAYEKLFGTKDVINEKSAFQKGASIGERFGATWTFGAEQMGLKVVEKAIAIGATPTQAAETARLTTQTPEVDAALTKLALMAEEGEKIKQAAELARVGAEDASGGEQHKYGLALKDAVGGRREFRKLDDAQKFIDNLDEVEHPNKGNLRVRASGRDSYYIAPIENLKTSFETPRIEEGSTLENVLSQDTFKEPGSNEMAVSRLPRVAVNSMLDSMELLEGAPISLERKLKESGLTREQWDSVQHDWQSDTYDSSNPDHMLVANMLLKMKRKLSNTSLGSTIPYDAKLVDEIGINHGAANVVDWIAKQNIPVISQLIDGYKNFPNELAKLSFVHEGPGWIPGSFHYLEDLGGGTVNMGQLPTRETAMPFARVLAHEITHHMTRELASRNDPAAQEFRVQNQRILDTLRKSEQLPKKVRDYLAMAQKENHYDKYRSGEISDITEHWRKALGNELTEQYSDVLYGLLNQDEMLSQMFSAHKFIAFLDSTLVPKSEGKGALNWFSKIWSKLVGRPDEGTATAFEELLRGYDNYLTGGVLRKVYNGMDFIRDSLVKEGGSRPEALASRMQTVERTFAKGDLYNSIYGFQRESETGTLPVTMSPGQIDQPLRTALVSGEIRDVFRGTMSLLPDQLPTHQDLWYRMQQDVKLAQDLVRQVKSGTLPGVDLPAWTESNLKLASAKLASMKRALNKQALALERQAYLSNFQTPFVEDLLAKQLLAPSLPSPESPAPETAQAQALMGLRKLSPQRTLAEVKEATSGEQLAGKGLGWLEKQLALTSFFKKVHPESRPVLDAVQNMHGQAMEWSRELGLVLNSTGDASKGESLKVDLVLRKQLERVATTKPLTDAFSDVIRTIAEKNKMGEKWDWSQPEFKQILRPLNQSDRTAVQAMQRQFMLRQEHFVNNIVPKAFGELNQENTGQVIAALQGGILPEQARDLSSKLHQALQNLNDPSTSMVGQALLSEVQSQLSPQTFLAALRHANQSVMDVNQFLQVARKNLDFVSEQRFDKEHMRMTGPDGQRFYTSAGTKQELQKRRVDLEARGYKFNYYTEKANAQSPSGGVNPEIMQKFRDMDTLAVTRLSEALAGRQDSAELMARILPEVQRAAEYTSSTQAFAPVPHVTRNLVEGREYLNMIHNADEFYGRGVNWLKNKILTSKTGLDMMHPEVAGNQVLKDYLTQHVKNYQTPDNPLVRKFTEAMFYQRMAFNLGNTMLEGVQSLGTGMQALIAETGSVRDAFKLTGEAAKEWAYQKAKGRGTNDEMDWLMRKAQATGATEPALWDDIYDPERVDMMSISAKLGAPVKKGTDVLKSAARSFSTFFQKYNNNIALIASYKIGRERGMGQEDAFKFARDVKERGTFTGGKPQRSVGLWGIKSRPVPQLMSSLQTYVLGWFNQMANDYRIGFKGAGKDITAQQRAGSKKAFIYGLAAQAVLAGGLGLPGVGQGIALLHQATGLDLKGWLRQNLATIFDEDQDSGGLLTNLALRGVGNAVSPIDPSNRAAIAVPFVGVDPYKGFSIAALAGAPGSSVSDFVQGIMAAARGDVQGFQKLLPSVLRGSAQLLQGDGDVRDNRGALLQTLSPAERWMQGLGLPSSRIQRSRDMAEALKNQEDSLQRTKEAQVDGLAKLVRQGNLTEVQRQMILAKQSDPTLDLRSLSKSIAGRVVAQTVPYEARHNINPGIDMAGMSNRAPSSELLRRNIAYGVQQSLGFQPTYNPRADVEAASLDDALNADPFLRRDQALKSLRGTRPTRHQFSPPWTSAFQ